MEAGEFAFDAPMWQWTNDATSWWFVSLPAPIADDIDQRVPRRPGFGSVRVHVTVGSSTWSTSVFPSNEAQTYVLPVKKDVRRRERLAEGDVVRVRMTLAE